MSRWSRSMSPAALVLSVLALVVATSAGTAYAAVKIGTKQLKNGAVTSAKIRDGGVTSVDLRDGGVTSADVLNGSLGLGDISASARASLQNVRAYATVDPNESGGGQEVLDGARTSGFASVERVSTGAYCLTLNPSLGLSGAAKAIVGVEPQYTSWSGGVPSVSQRDGCPAGQIRVITTMDGVLDNLVGFTVVVP